MMGRSKKRSFATDQFGTRRKSNNSSVIVKTSEEVAGELWVSNVSFLLGFELGDANSVDKCRLFNIVSVCHRRMLSKGRLVTFPFVVRTGMKKIIYIYDDTTARTRGAGRRKCGNGLGYCRNRL